MLALTALGCAATQDSGPTRFVPPGTSGAAASSRPRHAPPELLPELTVATFNIFAASQGVQRVADAIAALNADVIGLQEVDVATGRARGVDTLALIAQRLDMYAAFGKAMDFDGGAFGVALLSRTPLERVRTTPLPSAPGAEPRVLLTACTSVRGLHWTVAVSHLASHLDGPRAQDLRRDQARAIAEQLGGRERTLLLADLNAEASSNSFVSLHFIGNFVGLDAGPTHPAQEPSARLDHIIASPDLIALESRVVHVGASDHRALLARVARAMPDPAHP